MANLTSANGIVSILANNVESIEVLKKCFKLMKDQEYYTCVYGLDEAPIEKGEEPYKLKLFSDFDAVGKGCYQNNVEFFIPFIKNFLNENELKTLEDNDWELYYHFYDYEYDSGFITEQVLTLTHTASTELSKTVFLEVKSVDIESNLVNREKYIGMDFWEEFEALSEGEDPENVVDLIEENQEVYKEYFGRELIDDLISKGYNSFVEAYKNK